MPIAASATIDDEDPVLGLVALAAGGSSSAVRGSGLPERGERRRGHQPASPASRATAATNARPRGGVVLEHVERRGRGAEDDRRDGPCRAVEQRLAGEPRAAARRPRPSWPRGRSARGRPSRNSASSVGPLSPMSTAASRGLADDPGELAEVDALVPAAGDEHDRRRERAQRRDDRVGLRALGVVDEPDAVDERDRLEPVLDAGEGRGRPRGSRRARARTAARRRSRPARSRRCGRPGCRARRPA